MKRMDAATLEHQEKSFSVSGDMRAAVYRGKNQLALERVSVPEVGDGELLVRVQACGVCGTDIKKIEYGLVEPPKIFGHETAGTVVHVGRGVTEFAPGDRVAVHHHIPCRRCFYCRKRLYSQCESYRRTGTTAGFEPAGGGFAEYIRVMEWIVQDGTVRIPDQITFEEASFLEPLNTCLRGLETAQLEKGEVVAILGQGPIGLLLLQAASCGGADVIGLDLIETRLEMSRRLGARLSLNPDQTNIEREIGDLTGGRRADLAIVATANPRAVASAQRLVRRGGRVLLFAQTIPGETIPVDLSQICVEEKKLIGSYSASIELQSKAAELIFSRTVKVAGLVTHRFGLDRVLEGIQVAARPSRGSLKVMIRP